MTDQASWLLTHSDQSGIWSIGGEGVMQDVEVGSYEAKTKLPELLRGVQAGHRYTITLRGQPIAVRFGR